MDNLPSNKPYFDKVACSTCQLYKTCSRPLMEGANLLQLPRIPVGRPVYHRGDGGGLGQWSGRPDILFVGEAPGHQEDEQGFPFVGESGSLLRTWIKQAGISRVKYRMRFTNAVRCRPPGNELPGHAIAACKAAVLQEIEDLKPRVVVLMGNTAMRAVLSRSGITAARGRPVMKNRIIYLPTFHPAHVLRDRSAAEDLVNDILMLAKIVSGKFKIRASTKIPTKAITTSKEALVALDGLRGAKLVSWDLETSGLDAFDQGSEILTAGFTRINEDDSLSEAFAIPIDHRQSPMNIIERLAVVGKVKEILSDPTIAKLGHNQKFDAVWVRQLLQCEVRGALFDTMLMHYTIDERRGIHGLKQLAHVYTPFGDYEWELHQAQEQVKHQMETDSNITGSVWENTPLDLLLKYNAMDAYVTAYLYKKLRPLVGREQQTGVLKNLLFPAIAAIADVEHAGIAVNKEAVAKLLKHYQADLAVLQKKIHKDSDVREVVQRLRKSYTIDRVHSLESIRMCREKYTDEIEALSKEYVSVAAQIQGIEDRGEIPSKQLQRRQKSLLNRKAKKEYSLGLVEIRYQKFLCKMTEATAFKTASVPHMRMLAFDILKLPAQQETLTGKSVDKKLLETHQNKIQILRNILKEKKILKLLGTYILPLHQGTVIKSDGKVHPNFLLHGTTSGRLSCGSGGSGQGTEKLKTAINIQTLPRAGGIRALFCSSFDGGYLVSADFCLTGDTMVETVKGPRMLKDLVEDPCPVLSVTPVGKFEYQPVLRQACLGEMETWELELDDGSIIRGTPEHKFMLRDGTYRELRDLRAVDRLFPFRQGLNHKVAAVRPSKQTALVYNITVAKNHNYVLSSGIVSANCQLEFVVMGILANDPAVLDAAFTGKDLHVMSASLAFHVPPEEVTPDQRQVAKAAVSFGLLYGRAAPALAEDMSRQTGKPWSLRKAYKFIDNFFEGYPGLRQYQFSRKVEARDNGYVVSPFGRRRRLPNIYSNNIGKRGHAEREAMNTPVQGGASDLTLLSLIRIIRALKKRGMRARVVAMIHDQIVVDTPPEEVDAVKVLLQSIMENLDLDWLTAPLRVEIIVSKTLSK